MKSLFTGIAMAFWAASAVAGPKPMAIEGVILRPESLTRWFIGQGGTKTYFENVEEVLDGVKKSGARNLYIEMRAVDSAMSGREGRSDQRSALYFKPSASIKHAKVYRTDAPYHEDFSDPNYLRALVDGAHKRGLKVQAWFPTFNDRALWQAHKDYQVQPPSSADPKEESFVSPAHPEVRAHELRLIEEILSQFPVDGVVLDWIRYTQEDQPQDRAAAEAYRKQYGSEIKGPAKGGRRHPEWERYLAFRAALLTGFFREAKALCDRRKVELGAFLMPHSAKLGPEEAVEGRWGYRYEPWSGVDYNEIKKVGVKLMPMVYWDNQLNWKRPWPSWTAFTEQVNQNLSAWVKGSPSSYLPVYSAAYSVDELAQGFQLARKHGVNQVVMFYYGEWNKPWPATEKNTKLDNLVEVLRRVN